MCSGICQRSRIVVPTHNKLSHWRQIIGVPLVRGRVGRATRLTRRFQLRVILIKQLDMDRLDQSRLILLGVVGNVDLLQLGLRLRQLDPLLLHIAVSGLPSVIVLNDALERLPWQVLATDLAKVLANLGNICNVDLFCYFLARKTCTSIVFFSMCVFFSELIVRNWHKYILNWYIINFSAPVYLFWLNKSTYIHK